MEIRSSINTLFRGKRTDNGEWVYGTPIFQDAYTLIRFWNSEEFKFEEYLVAPETVSQYTVTIDKNNKRIFEGDVVLYLWNNDKYERFYIAYVKGEFLAVPVRCATDIWPIRISGYNEQFDIIGNIYDNPQLVKK